MKTIGIIPARYGSSRFPGKPLVDMRGKPMIQRVYEQVKKALHDVYVATDNQQIFDTVARFGGDVVMTRDDHQSGTDRIAEALEKITSDRGKKYDIVLNVQGDEPFIHPEQILSLKHCFDDPNTDIATLVKIIDNEDTLLNPNSPKVVIGKGAKALYFSRSPIPYCRNEKKGEWLKQHPYYKHIGIYGYRSEVLNQITRLAQSPLELAESLEQLRWLENGFTIKTALTDFEGLAVDTPEDLDLVLQYLDKKI